MGSQCSNPPTCLGRDFSQTPTRRQPSLKPQLRAAVLAHNGASGSCATIPFHLPALFGGWVAVPLSGLGVTSNGAVTAPMVSFLASL
jgi:hypothetical protein